jgi:hypothetical protein
MLFRYISYDPFDYSHFLCPKFNTFIYCCTIYAKKGLLHYSYYIDQLHLSHQFKHYHLFLRIKQLALLHHERLILDRSP